METIPDRGRHDPDIAAKLAELRRIVTFDAAAREAEARAAPSSASRWVPPTTPGEAQSAPDGEIAAWQAAVAAPATRPDPADLTPAYAEHLARQGALDAARIRELEATLRRRDLIVALLCLLTIWLVGR